MGNDFQFNVFLNQNAEYKHVVRELAARSQQGGPCVRIAKEQIKLGHSIPGGYGNMTMFREPRYGT